jgi:hypothetical protein
MKAHDRVLNEHWTQNIDAIALEGVVTVEGHCDV